MRLHKERFFKFYIQPEAFKSLLFLSLWDLEYDKQNLMQVSWNLV